MPMMTSSSQGNQWHWHSSLMGIFCGRLSKNRVMGAILLFVVIYNEWLSHALKAQSWKQLTKEERSVTILFAADPQILSTKSEPYFPFNLLTTWDADRFVGRALSLALWRTQPDVVVFLGDLLDDGSISTDEEFETLAEHFKNVMHIPTYVKKVVYVPGDNDIGGEGSDVITTQKVQRFQAAFGVPAVVTHSFVQLITMKFLYEKDNYTSLISTDKNTVRILLSHMPLLPITRKPVKQRIIKMLPSIIFSGHEHESFYFSASKTEANAQEFRPLRDENHEWIFDTSGVKLHEVTVPTCSYRMGKPRYGFGVAVIGGNCWP